MKGAARHGRFPHPGPLPEGEGEMERAACDFHRKGRVKNKLNNAHSPCPCPGPCRCRCRNRNRRNDASRPLAARCPPAFDLVGGLAVESRQAFARHRSPRTAPRAPCLTINPLGHRRRRRPGSLRRSAPLFPTRSRLGVGMRIDSGCGRLLKAGKGRGSGFGSLRCWQGSDSEAERHERIWIVTLKMRRRRSLSPSPAGRGPG